MTVEAVLAFSPLHESQAPGAVHAISLLPSLSERALEELEVGWDATCRALLVRARLASLEDRVRNRLEFWVARAGGRLWMQSGVFPARARMLGFIIGCRDRLVEAAARERIRALLQAALADAAGFSPLSVPADEGPVLSMHVGGPGWEAVSYDRRSHSVLIPTPLAPPVGDEFLLHIVEPDARQGAVGAARVTRVLRRGDPSPGACAGFIVSVEAPAVHTVLAMTTTRLFRRNVRRAARLPAHGRVRLTVEPPTGEGAVRCEGTLRHISGDGAFVITAAPLPADARVVRVEFNLSGEEELVTNAEVERTTPDGVALRFDASSQASGAIASMITGVMGRRRRVLLLQDEDSSRAAVTAAFRRRGYDVLATGDLVYGVQLLATEILSVDVLVVGPSVAGCDGLDLVHRAREALGGAPLPVMPSKGTPSERPALLRLATASPDEDHDAVVARIDRMLDSNRAHSGLDGSDTAPSLQIAPVLVGHRLHG